MPPRAAGSCPTGYSSGGSLASLEIGTAEASPFQPRDPSSHESGFFVTGPRRLRILCCALAILCSQKEFPVSWPRELESKVLQSSVFCPGVGSPRRQNRRIPCKIPCLQ